jgi:hypothetical protein
VRPAPEKVEGRLKRVIPIAAAPIRDLYRALFRLFRSAERFRVYDEMPILARVILRLDNGVMVSRRPVPDGVDRPKAVTVGISINP